MPFIQEILKYKSLSIVGLEKNTGKTECLNYILNRLPLSKIKVAVTSIGIDGEGKDRVTETKKPEIYLKKGVIFSTDEANYNNRDLVSNLLQITGERGALGRIITAECVIGGKILLSGPSYSEALKRWSREVEVLGVDLKIIDGAISRISSASPAISEAMILATGAALSLNINTLVAKTKFMVELIKLGKVSYDIAKSLEKIDSGIWEINSNGKIKDLGINSSLLIGSADYVVLKKVKRIFLSGALTDKFIERLENKKIEIIVRDFTKIFLSELEYRKFIAAGGKILVLERSNLIAVCVNPTSPKGYSFNSDVLCEALKKEISIPVYDIFKEIRNEI